MATLTGTLRRPGVELRYLDSEGDGPAVVFLHGAGADHLTFEAQAKAIVAGGGRAVLVDLRGQGQSRPNDSRLTADLLVDDVNELVAQLALQQPVIVGHSLGGSLGQALVRKYPKRFGGLAVIGSTWNTGPLRPIERMLLRLAAPSLAAIPERRMFAIMADASAFTPFAKADALRAFSQLTKREFLAVWRATVEFVAPDPDYRTPVPLLLIRGAEDRTGNIASAMPAWAAAEGVVEHVIADAGHLVTQDAPEAVNVILRAFVADLRTAG